MRGKNKGERNGNAKLTDIKVIKIRKARGLRPQTELAARYGVSVGLIGMIHRREIWRHVRVPR
jgi:hypothetical protein